MIIFYQDSVHTVDRLIPFRSSIVYPMAAWCALNSERSRLVWSLLRATLIITEYDSFGPSYSYLRVDGRGFNSTLCEFGEVWVESEPSGVENVITGQNYGP
jgi:hypothetical protein